MPNGGRKGDNRWSWFTDALCEGREEYLGDPIDSLACKTYRITGDEHAAGIGPDNNRVEIDRNELEAKLRKRLAELNMNQDEGAG